MMEDRLGRVEKKIDTLQEAIVSLARVEERISSVFERQAHIEDKVDDIDKKVGALSTEMASSKVIERLVWLVIAAAVTVSFTLIG